MANNYVQVPPNSTGLKMQTFENTVSANVVESEAVTLVRSSDNTEIGTAAQPVRVDPTGTTTQPVSGTVTAVQATGANLHVDVDNFPGTQPISGTVSISGNVSDNVVQWGGTNVEAAQTSSDAGTGAQPLVRSTTRRYGAILSTTPLGANGTFTSAWFDTNQT